MKCSIALATYNGGRFLAEQLDSLLRQTRRPDELVICDDASTDGTLAIVGRFADSAPFTVRIHENPVTGGSTRNFARAIGLCTGDFIFLCDQDDVWHPEKLARFGGVFRDGAVGLVASDLELMDAAGRSLGRRLWTDLSFTPAMRASAGAGGGPRFWLRTNTVTGAAMAFRADLRDAILPIPPEWVHDAWIALICGSLAEARFLDEPLTRYRIHPHQQIGAAPRSPGRGIHAARGMDAEYFARAVHAFGLLETRLAALGDRLRDGDILHRVREKIEFTLARRRMREGGRHRRIAPAFRGLLSGDYRNYAKGWRAFAADLLL